MIVGSTGLFLYRLCGIFAVPFVRLLLWRRVRLGKEDPIRYKERLGYSSAERPDSLVVWVHGASMGEAVSVLPLIKRLISESEAFFLITTGTVTSAELLRGRLPARAVHQYVPVDLPVSVERFLDHWRPSLALFVESELWPAMLAALTKRNVRHILLNGRISSDSFRRWKRLQPIAQRILAGFDFCLAQSELDAKRLRALGAREVILAGNIKYSAEPLKFDNKKLISLRDKLGNRPLWVAASTHQGEEIIAANVHQAILRQIPSLLTVVVPRHPDRGEAVERDIAYTGLRIHRRKKGEQPELDTDIYLADTIGEMGLWYSLASVVGIGKSLSVSGGQNPIEPARFGCAIICGNRMENFTEVVQAMLAADAILQVDGPEALAIKLTQLLSRPEQAAAMGAKAKQFSEARVELLDRVADLVKPAIRG